MKQPMLELLASGKNYYSLCEPLVKIRDEDQSRFVVVVPMTDEEIILRVDQLPKPVVYNKSDIIYTLVNVTS